MRVVFMGTPEFAVPTLDALVEAGHEVVLVVAQPDKPAGRGNVLTPPPVAVRATALGLPLVQPKAVRTGAFPARLREVAPDVAVVLAYGRILTAEHLATPRYGCVNVHGSLLPRWRGASPIQAAVLAGDAETGVCTQRMVEALDAGDVYLERRVLLDPRETAGSLHDRLMPLAAEVAVATLAQLPGLQPKPQVGDATYCGKIDKGMGRVDWTQSAEAIDRRVRAMTPWPGGFVERADGALKLLEVDRADGSGIPGTVLSLSPLVVACGEGALRLVSVQAPGRKPVPGPAYANGARLVIGASL
jgi:methionyl-tRNA formyltransferase